MTKSSPKWFPMLENKPPIPWELAEAFYRCVYEPLDNSQSLTRIAERGGFAYAEIEAFCSLLYRRMNP